jgi:ubiquinol-cytochrome c reductase iron-sulfur subunit
MASCLTTSHLGTRCVDSDSKVNQGRRRLIVATAAAGGAIGVGVAVPFVESMLPSERAKAAGAPVEVDISKIPSGQMITVAWRGQPVWVINRDKEMLAAVKGDDSKVSDPHSEQPQQPAYCKNEYRSIKPDLMVVVGICTHLGCTPSAKFEPGAASGMGTDWTGGFYCPCHGSVFDFAGRVFKDKPAPVNLVVPPYMYLSDTKIVIGDDKKKA